MKLCQASCWRIGRLGALKIQSPPHKTNEETISRRGESYIKRVINQSSKHSFPNSIKLN